MPIRAEVSERVFSRNPRERELLREKHLIIVGLGSVGSALALMGARAGVGRFTLIDADEVQPENIARHFCDLDTIGQPKAEAVADLIHHVNPAADTIAFNHDFRAMDRSSL